MIHLIHFFWTGRGFLVAVIAFGFALIANLIANSLTGSQVFWDTHKWPMALSLFASAAVCWKVGWFLHSRKPRVLIDPKTGKEFVLRQTHTFFFLPVMTWGPIFLVGGLIALVMDFVK